MTNGEDMVSEGSPVHDEKPESEVVHNQDRSPEVNQPGTEDENEVLRALLGDHDEDGIYRAGDVAEGEDG